MIEVLHPGLYTTIQDLGRFGYRNQGVPESGAMDAISAKLANSLLDNNSSDAVLEITMMGPKLVFKVKTLIAITGANISPKVNGVSVVNDKLLVLEKGAVLSFGKLLDGIRCYVAVRSGIQSEIKLKSRSQFKNITKNASLAKGELLLLKSNSESIDTQKGIIKNRRQFYETSEIEVSPAPEFELFSESQIANFLSQSFTVSNDNNRMGYRMKEMILPHDISLITSPVLPGTVQLLPSGKIIVLMRDAQTTGGYPRIFQLTEMAISILAQKRIGEKLKLKLSPILI